jgi:23S rRNA (uridine2552-2'-O)-methyltransferase
MPKVEMIKMNRWEDHYTRKARDEKWLARSVYKLEEIDRKFRLIHRGDDLLDLGCYPGSWVQYGVNRVGPRGEVVGVDLKEPTCFSAPNFRFIKADVFKLDLHWLFSEIGPRHVVMSDIAPQTTGIRVADSCRSMELAERALEIALAMLRKKGHFLCKVFEGKDFRVFRNEFSHHFELVRLIRPSAVRKGSRELYVLGLRRKA